MNTYTIDPEYFRQLTVKFRGYVFYRIDEKGNHLIKPLKTVEHIIKQFEI